MSDQSSGEGPRARTGTMANILGISEVHLGRLANGGVLPKLAERGAWDVAATVQAYVAYMVQQATGDEKSTEDLKSEELRLLTARRRRAEAAATTEEIRSGQALGIVVLRQDAETAMASFCQVLKTGLGNAVSRVASRATTMNSASEIQELAETEINRALRAARTDLSATWARRGTNDAGSDDSDIGAAEG